MAYKMSDVGGFGTGALGDITNPSGQINSYANVTAISTNTVTIGTASAGIYEAFVVGKEILLHVSAVLSGTDATKLGKYLVATITGVSGSVLTLSKDVAGLIAAGVFANHHVQAITVAQFDTLNLSATIAPRAYSTTDKYGGIICFKCKTALNLSGSGKIDLAAKGIPVASVALRPATAQETNANQMGWENHITARNLYLNCPDGAAFIAAKTTTLSGTTARIGGSTAGVSKYPYNTTFANASASVVKGGPTILWASESITGFDPSIISKTSSNSSGSGLGMCYIATETNLAADEQLYALDCLSNPARLMGLGIKSYGTGALGDITNPTGQLNSYANVTAIAADGRTLTIGTEYGGAYERIESGSTVMLHVSRQAGSDQTLIGKFVLAKILSVSGNTAVLDTIVTDVIAATAPSNYKCQLITVAQFNNLTCSSDYTYSKAYNDTQGCGGVLAIAVKGTLDLSGGGKLNMEGKGIDKAVSRPAVSWQIGSQQKDRLILSQGTGAVFLVANNLTLSATSRIGATWSGAAYFGLGGPYTSGSSTSAGENGSVNRGGKGGDYNSGDYIAGGYAGSAGGFGGPGRTSDGQTYSQTPPGPAGASIFIIANTITGFNLSACSCGGKAGTWIPSGANYGQGQDAGSGYGGGGAGGTWAGASSAGGGGPGSCFIYANTITNPDYTAYLAS